MAVSPPGSIPRCASVDRAGQVHIHRIDGPHELLRTMVYNDGSELSQLTCVCWHGDEQIAFGSASGHVRIRHVEDASFGLTTQGRAGHSGPVYSVTRCGSRGHLVLSSGQDGKIRLFDPRSRWGMTREVSTVSAAYHPVRSVAATVGGEDYTTAVACDGGSRGGLSVFDTRRPRGMSDDPSHHGLQADPRWRAGTHSPKGNAVARLEGHTSLARAVAMSESGSVVVSGSDDCTVRFWDLSRSSSSAAEGADNYSFFDEEKHGQWGGGLSSGGSGVWGGVGTCLELSVQRIQFPRSVVSLGMNPTGRCVLAGDLDGGVYCRFVFATATLRQEYILHRKTPLTAD